MLLMVRGVLNNSGFGKGKKEDSAIRVRFQSTHSVTI
jgi:hypothetical protein